jgi:hypothetical protein
MTYVMQRLPIFASIGFGGLFTWFVWPTAYEKPTAQALWHFNRFTGVKCALNESC